MIYQHTFTTKWADFDPNRHMRHSAYYDYTAEVRVRFFSKHGLSINEFAKLNIGPILFKEEASFYKEINIGEDIKVDMALEAASENLERWRFTHTIYNGKGETAAVVKVYGAWIDLIKRKLTAPPKEIFILFSKIIQSESVEKIILSPKK
jgi:acyl-CoA thioester hydrolase